MSRKLRKPSPFGAEVIRSQVYRLRSVRDCLRSVGAKKAAAYVQKALKSTEGALRHEERVQYGPTAAKQREGR